MTRRINRRRQFSLYALAVLVGIMGGSMPQLFTIFGVNRSSQESMQPGSGLAVDGDFNASKLSDDERLLIDRVEPSGHGRMHDGEDNLVVAGRGVVLHAAYGDGEFIGYEVIESVSDPRMSPGDIIVAVNGGPVENSAAGGELLIIGLNDPNASIELVFQQ